MKAKLLLPLLLLAFIAGCATAPVVFRPQARPINRIASAYEVLTELNGEVADLVTAGILTQAQVNRSIGPALDEAQVNIEAAEALYRAGKIPESQTKVDQVSNVLTTIRNYLATLKGRK